MLNRQELAYQISKLSSLLFPDLKNQSVLAESKWAEISADPSFVDKVLASRSSFLIPGWSGNLTDTFAVNNDLQKYSVLAVDGSQIYPDRNIPGAGCFLLNLGGCCLEYGKKDNGKTSSKVNFFSEPQVFLPENIVPENGSFSFSPDLVDLKREELELKKLFEVGKAQNFDLCFVDGSLIFWHLEGKHPEVKEHFLKSYLFYLNKFYENNILVAGYISFPKSKELVNLIKLGLCRFTAADCIACNSNYDNFPCKAVDSLIDSSVVRMFLEPFERTTIFWSKSKIVENYPDELKPCFFYLNVDSEIVRIELPAWIAQDSEKLDLICKIAIDQSLKGSGYPVCLAESHEQAVVKGPDREFFHHLIYKIGIEQKRRFFVSQKSLKKRGIGI